MSPALQSIFALALVAFAVIWLVRRSLAKKKPGCGSDCGCASSEIKAAAVKVRKL